MKTSEKTTKRPRGTGSIYKRAGSRFWWIKYYRNGVPYREPTHGTTEREARRLLEKRKAEVTTGNFLGPQVERIRVAQLAEEMLREYRVNGRKSLEIAEQKWRKRLEPFFGALRAVDVTTDIINRYVETRLGQGAQNATVNRELAFLRRAFGLAYRSTPRKVYQVPVFPRLKENPPRKGFVEDQQYRQLCDNSKALWLRAMLALGYNFGFRKGELLSLRVRQIDLLNRTITLDPGTTKNDESRTVKMTSETFQLLCECLRLKRPHDFVFTRRDGQPVRDFRGAWAKLTNAAGLPGLLFHDLRRSAVRNMVRRGVPEVVAMRISGHKTRSVFDRYNVVSEADLTEAARRIENGHSSGTAARLNTTEQLANRSQQPV